MNKNAYQSYYMVNKIDYQNALNYSNPFWYHMIQEALTNNTTNPDNPLNQLAKNHNLQRDITASVHRRKENDKPYSAENRTI